MESHVISDVNLVAMAWQRTCGERLGTKWYDGERVRVERELAVRSQSAGDRQIVKRRWSCTQFGVDGEYPCGIGFTRKAESSQRRRRLCHGSRNLRRAEMGLVDP